MVASCAGAAGVGVAVSGSLWPVRCGWCDEVTMKLVRDVNRAEKRKANLYCNRECAGLARRNAEPLTEEQKRVAKAEYDRKRRAALGEELLAAKRAAYHAAVAADAEALRAKQREHRRKRKAEHAAYCRRPEYRNWKANYDRQYRAEKDFGPFAEAAIILNDLQAEISTRATRTEIYAANGTLNKWTQRRREYERQTDRG